METALILTQEETERVEDGDEGMIGIVRAHSGQNIDCVIGKDENGNLYDLCMVR